MLEEHATLERRVHNDSRTGYTIFAACIGAFGILLSVFANAMGNMASSDSLDWSQLSVAAVVALAALGLLWFGKEVVMRFNRTSRLRIARAVQVEEAVGIYSFRLFPPWSVLPPRFILTLGEYILSAKSNGTSEHEALLEHAGHQEYREITQDRRIQEMLRMLVLALGIGWFGLVVLMFALLVIL